jgi:hypothetical protein
MVAKDEGKEYLVSGLGDFYEGDHKEGKKEGKGTMKYANGDKCEGEFKDDKING